MEDPNSKFDISFANGEGKVKLPNHWNTTTVYRDLQKEPILEEWGPTELVFKYPSENVMSDSASANLSQLELQFVHTKKKPAKAFTPDFPEHHKDYSRLVISVMVSVYDSMTNKLNRKGDPFLFSLGLSAKFIDKNAKLQDKKWFESTLGPAIDWDMNKNFGDTHPDFKAVPSKSYDRYSFRYLQQLIG